jgi:hypothetical protein
MKECVLFATGLSIDGTSHNKMLDYFRRIELGYKTQELESKVPELESVSNIIKLSSAQTLKDSLKLLSVHKNLCTEDGSTPNQNSRLI